MICGIAVSAVNADSRRQKARRFYMEGIRLEQTGDDASAGEMYRRAYETDTSYSEAAYAYGSSRLVTKLDTLQSRTELLRSLDMIRSFVDKYPDDSNEAEYYALLAQLLDTLPESARVLERLYTRQPDRPEILIALARIYNGMGDLGKSIAALDSFEAHGKMNDEIAATRISMRIEQGDTAGAMADMNRLLTKYPTDVKYQVLKGQLYAFVEQTDSALAWLENVEREDTASALPKLALANIYKERNDSVSYDKMIYGALLTEDLEMEDKISILTDYLQDLISEKQDTVRGNYLFRVLNDQYPHEPELLDLAARYNAAKGNPLAAIEEIRYAIDQDPDNAAYWQQLMSYQIFANQCYAAIDTYDEAQEHLEDVTDLKFLYAVAAQTIGDYDTAVGVYESLIRAMVPDISCTDSVDKSKLRNLEYFDLYKLSGYYTSIGDIYFMAERLAEAFHAYDNALTIFPDNALAMNNYAYFLALEGKEEDLPRAAEMSKRSNELVTDNATYMDTYAWILFLQHDYTTALQYQSAAVEKAEADGEHNADLYAHYGDILFMNGKPDEALAYWKKALETNDNELKEKDIKLLKKKIEHKTFFYE